MQQEYIHTNHHPVEMDDLLIGCIMIQLVSRNCTLTIHQEHLVHPPFSIFFGLIINDLPGDERGYRQKGTKGGRELSGLLWSSWCIFFGSARTPSRFHTKPWCYLTSLSLRDRSLNDSYYFLCGRRSFIIGHTRTL
jgi:hypothetical protein